MGASPAPATPMSWPENTLTTQAMMMIPLRSMAPWPATDLPFKRWHAHQEEKRAQVHAQSPYVKQETVQRHDELVSGQATITARPREPPRHEPSPRVERILMMDFASTPTHTKGVNPTANHEEGHAKAATARPPKASPPPTVDGVDKMYCQLVEIHAITTASLAECTR
jgi:hypothetical protein